MKICMLVYAFYESDTRVQQYANALVERGDEVDVIALRRENQAPYERIRNVNVYRVQVRTVNEQGRFAYFYRIARFMAVAAKFLAKRSRSQKYDLIHIHSVPDFLVFAALGPKLAKTPLVLDIHDLLPELYASKFGLRPNSSLFRLLVRVEKWSIKCADHVIIANHIWHARLLSRSVEDEKCTTIRNYPDPNIFFPREKRRRDDKLLIIYPGTLNRHQGVDVAIRAIARVIPIRPEIEFHIYGEGSAKPELMNLVTELGLSSHVKFHDFLPTPEIAPIMAESDLAVEPKRGSSAFGNEAASTKILEFMAMRVPVIASDTRVHRYYYDNTIVKFFKSDNDAELADCILSFANDVMTTRELVAKAEQHVLENSWNTRKYDYLQLVDCLAASAPRAKMTPQIVEVP